MQLDQPTYPKIWRHIWMLPYGVGRYCDMAVSPTRSHLLWYTQYWSILHNQSHASREQRETKLLGTCYALDTYTYVNALYCISIKKCYFVFIKGFSKEISRCGTWRVACSRPQLRPFNGLLLLSYQRYQFIRPWEFAINDVKGAA